MNYTELSTAIQDTTENYDLTFVSNIPLFIQAAEKKIYNEVELPVVSTAVFGTFTAANPYLTLPADYLAPLELAVVAGGQWSYLYGKEVGYMREAYPDPFFSSVPKYYAQFDKNSLIVAPTPDAGYTVQLRYYAYPTSIVIAGTTWLGDNYPNLLLYAALVEAYIFMKGEQDILDAYGKNYAYELGLLKKLNNSKIPNDAYRGGQYSRS